MRQVRNRWRSRLGLAGLLVGLGLAEAAAAAEVPAVGLGPARTDWAQSPSCPGHQPRLAERLGQDALSRLAKEKAIRLVKGKQAKPRWVLGSEVLCMPDYVQWNLSLIEPATAEVGWVKAFEAKTAGELEDITPRAVKVLVAFLREGKMPDEVEPEPEATAAGPGDAPMPVAGDDGPKRLAAGDALLRGQAVVSMPLEASAAGLLPPAELQALDRRFERELARVAEAMVTPAPAALRALVSLGGRSYDEGLALGLAREVGAGRALLLEAGPGGGRCFLAASLLDARSGELLATQAVPCDCDPAGIEHGQDALLEALLR